MNKSARLVCINGELGDVFELPISIIKYVPQATETELKVILCLMAKGSSCDTDTLSEMVFGTDSEHDTDAVEAALCFWRGTGLVRYTRGSTTRPHTKDTPSEAADAQSDVTAKRRPTDYSIGELSQALEDSKELRFLYNRAQQMIGKTFNPSELSVLYGMYDTMKLPADFILLLIDMCVKDGKNSIRYIEKAGIGLSDSGINTAPLLESYITEKREREEHEGKVRRILGISGRALTSKEKKFISDWKDLNMSLELITKSYELTVERTGKLSFPYMGKILQNWHEKGFTTPEQVDGEFTGETGGESDIDRLFRLAAAKGLEK